MKAPLIAGALVCLLALIGATTASAAGPHKLRSAEARSAAESAAFEFEQHHKLDSSAVGRCKRTARQSMLCLATAKGETSRRMKVCRLRIKVRAVRQTVWGVVTGWDAAAAIVHSRCHTEVRPHLTYEAARAAIQAAADSFAGQATTITSMRRHILSFEEGEGAFSGRAEWERPALHPTEFEPTESCSVEVLATMSGGKISTSTEGFSCY